jgi:Flp pilus assembly protein TadD
MDSPVRLLDDAVNHHLQGRAEAAVAGYRRVLADVPAEGRALHLLGLLAAQRNGLDEAATMLERARRADPVNPAIRAHLAGVALRRGAPDAALFHLKAALTVHPQQADAVEYLGAACHALAGYREAVVWSLRAHALRPERAEPLSNLGTALRDARSFAAADTCFSAAIERDPNATAARLGLAVSRLVQGDLAGGFAAFEARWKRLPTPQWKGEPLNGRRLLIHGEQGYGDAIQFLRYVPLTARMGGRVTLEVHPALVRLFANIAEGVAVVARGDAIPPHDVQCPMMSLAHAFGTTLTGIPANVPYLRPDPAEAVAWASRLGDDGRPRVGLVWAGNPEHANDRNRSLPVAALAPLLAVPDIRFFSLQAGDARRDLPPGVTDAINGVRDFADSAALMANLDLVISVDTAPLHLAGALGRPAWGLIAFAPDWRWLIDRDDSPWYPTLTLFRQSEPGDWRPAMDAATARLRILTTRKNPPGNSSP